MKKKSFLRMMNTLSRVQMGLVTALMLVFILFAYDNALDKQTTALENYLAVFSLNIDNQVTKTDEALAEIVYDNGDLVLLFSEDEAERQYAAISLFRELQNSVRNLEGADSIIVVQTCDEMCIETRRQGVSFVQQQLLREFTMEYAREGVQTGAWELLRTEEGIFLFRALLYSQRAVISFLSLDTLLGQIPGQLTQECVFFLADGDGQILSATGALPEQTLEGMGSVGGILLGMPVAEGTMELYVYQNAWEVLAQFSGAMAFLLALLLVLWVFGIFSTRAIRRELLTPMEIMTADMARVKEDQLTVKIRTQSDSVEFQTLVEAFNSLVQRIMDLKIQYYEKRISLMDAEQKYIRLQLRPHYFLNAMSTIVGLSRAGKNEQIEDYVNALSKTIRYMFSSGLHTVPAAEELRHVENYIRMQELKYPQCVLYFVDIAEEAKHWPIPQMLIQTVVENEYKYAVSAGDQLMVLIKLSVVREGDEELLLIEIEDNGKGYPEKIIRSLNDPAARPSDDGARVGLWSIRRLLELMYERQGLLRLSNVEPHGAMSAIRIPARPVHQRGQPGQGEEPGPMTQGGEELEHSAGG